MRNSFKVSAHSVQRDQRVDHLDPTFLDDVTLQSLFAQTFVDGITEPFMLESIFGTHSSPAQQL